MMMIIMYDHHHDDDDKLAELDLDQSQFFTTYDAHDNSHHNRWQTVTLSLAWVGLEIGRACLSSVGVSSPQS